MPSASLAARVRALPSPANLATLRELIADPTAIDRLDGDASTIAELRTLVADPATAARVNSMVELIELLRSTAAQLAEEADQPRGEVADLRFWRQRRALTAAFDLVEKYLP